MTKLVLLFTALFLVSCNYRVDKSLKNAGDIAANGDEKAGVEAPPFSEIKADILKEQCIGCHAKYANYAVVLADLSKIRESVVSGRMPKDGSLSAEEKTKLLSWIDAGAPEEGRAPSPASTPVPPTPTPLPTATPAPTPTPTPFPTPIAGQVPSFDEVAEKVFAPRCSRCHGPGEFEILKGSDAATNAADIKRRVLLPMGTKGRMPPKQQTLSEGELAWILAWVEGGAPITTTPQPQPTPAPTPEPTPEPTPAPTPAETIEPTYASINATIFKSHECLKCHTNSEEGEFVYDMNSLASIRKDDAKAAAAKNPALSLMIEAVTATGRGRMPPGTRPPLTPKEIEVLKRWFELGLPE